MNSKRKHHVRNAMLLLLLLLFFAEVIVRIVFAAKEYPVGKLAPTWMAFQPVDSFVLQQSCFTDSQGIYKPQKDFWEKHGHRINNENFRGIDFIRDTLQDSSASVLFIGDSFVWGSHATPIDSCFVDLLNRDENLICFNAGVPGTDPAQYAAVAARYIPQLRPDITVVAVYLANDLMSEPRAIIPNEELWYQTNAGWLPASHKGMRFSSAQESYNYISNKYAANSIFEKLLLKSAIGTAMLSLPFRLEEYAEWNKKRKSPVTNDYLKQIKSVCGKWNSRLMILIIPAAETDLTEAFFRDAKSYVQDQYPALMNGLGKECFVFPAKKELYYAPPDGHLNNKGHRVAAEFIRLKIISATPL